MLTAEVCDLMSVFFYRQLKKKKSLKTLNVEALSVMTYECNNCLKEFFFLLLFSLQLFG